MTVDFCFRWLKSLNKKTKIPTMMTRKEILVGFIKDKYFILSVNNKAAKIITNTATIKYLIIKQFLQLVIYLRLFS